MSEGKRVTKAAAKVQFAALASAAGWETSTRGWPAFFLRKGGEVTLVEVTSSSSAAVNDTRLQVLVALAGCGVSCYRWSPDGGFERIGGEGKGTIGVGMGIVDDPKSENSQREGGPGETPQTPLDAGPSQDETTRQINEVWAHYVAVMEPRSDLAGDEERRIIAAALKVATAVECCRAIEACKASDFHQGANNRGRRYNSLSQVLKAKRGVFTTRERIDFWLDRWEKSPTRGANVPSASAAQIDRRKEIVRRGHRFRDDPEWVQRAEEAEAWLAERGINTVRDEEGFPRFRAGGSA